MAGEEKRTLDATGEKQKEGLKGARYRDLASLKLTFVIRSTLTLTGKNYGYY
jgi:hypothetical protein